MIVSILILKNAKPPILANKLVYCCPEEFCRKSKMASLQAINIHLGKKHPNCGYKMQENPKGSPIARMT